LVVVCHDENVQRWWGKLPQRFLVFGKDNILMETGCEIPSMSILA